MWKKEDDWFWEGNVQKNIAEYLQEQGFDVKATDTISKSTGVDIVAKKAEKNILIEVKGWPSDKYMDGPKKGQPKPTHPTLQAKHWLSEAFLTVIRRKSKFPGYTLAIGLPKFRRYTDLLNEISWAIETLGIKIFLVDSTGKVSEL